MAETLLSPTGVLLYGRVLQDLSFNFVAVDSQGPHCGAPPPPRLGQNLFLQGPLQAANVRLARIYGFSYEGHYYDLAKPAIFIVHGDGTDPDEPVPTDTNANRESRMARTPADTDRTGVAGTSRSFSDDIRVWSYDKGDFSIRLDVETGSFEQILLQAEIRTERVQMHYSGDRARLRPPRGGGYSD